jgi:hypothetical protein
MLKFVSFQQLFVELMEGSQKALAPWAMDNTPGRTLRLDPYTDPSVEQ